MDQEHPEPDYVLELRGAWGGTTLPPIRWVDSCHIGTPDPVAGLQVSAILACVRVLAESIASLPCRLYRRRPDGSKELAEDSPLYRVLHDRPNSWQSSYEFRETLIAHCAMWGNAYALIRRNERGDVDSLVPMHPSEVTVSRLQNDAIAYDWCPIGGSPTRYLDDSVLHVRWLSDNGYMGMVPLSLNKTAIELARSMERYSAQFWNNNAKPGVVLTTTQPIPPEGQERLRNSWERLHRGTENAGRTAVLPNGVTVQELAGATNESAQLVEMQIFVVQQIARAFRVPCSMIGENSKTSYASAEQEALSFVQHSLLSWCRRVESAFERALLDDLPGYSISLDVRGLLRGDSASRAAMYRDLFALGAITPNEIRQLEDMPAVALDAADKLYIPVNNFAPLGSQPEGVEDVEDS